MDFSKPFFDSWNQLSLRVPRPSSWIFYVENCDFCHCVGWSKNCYMSCSSDESENLLFSDFCYKNINCLDCSGLKVGELCYECIDSS